MTEQEALTKWCPQHGRIKSPAERALSPGMCCIGSACMAWRYSAPEIEYGSAVIGETANPFTFKPTGDGWSFGKGRRWERSAPAGFCGLAGKP